MCGLAAMFGAGSTAAAGAGAAAGGGGLWDMIKGNVAQRIASAGLGPNGLADYGRQAQQPKQLLVAPDLSGAGGAAPPAPMQSGGRGDPDRIDALHRAVLESLAQRFGGISQQYGGGRPMTRY